MSDTNRIGGIHYEIMRSCYNPKALLYKNNGAKGIKVCEEWHDRETFRKWCNDNGYIKGMQLLRHDTSKDYCPENCYLSEPITRAKHDYSEFVKKRAAYNHARKTELGLDRLIDSPLRCTYASMHDRCERPKNDHYALYGGRGIKVCEEWSGKYGFYHFIEWANSNGWKPELTLDRIDNDKGYSPDNCRWATILEQAKNRRTTHHYDYYGEDLTRREIAERENISCDSLSYRLNKGMDIYEAVKAAKAKKNK